jgi:hypothetical protein
MQSDSASDIPHKPIPTQRRSGRHTRKTVEDSEVKPSKDNVPVTSDTDPKPKPTSTVKSEADHSKKSLKTSTDM